MNALADRIEGHADALERGRRSPLYVALMRGAARDARAGGSVTRLFPGGAGTPGSVPAGRLMAALHHLVLAGAAPTLAHHYPSVGGRMSPEGAWVAAEETIRRNLERVHDLCALTVQTNDPGRSAALYGGLLWLAERHRLPINLLELGASAGLNLHADRYRYVVGGRPLGDPASPMSLSEPWDGLPVGDPWSAERHLSIQVRRGCDRVPVDASTPEGALRLLSYVWPDEPERLARTRAAIEIARAHPVAVDAAGAASWVERRLGERHAGRLTVVWQSIMRQYLDDAEQCALETGIEHAGATADPDRPIAWLTMEPAGEDHLSDFRLCCRSWPGGLAVTLADTGTHGPPVSWWPTG